MNENRTRAASADLTRYIEQAAEPRTRPDGSGYRSLLHQDEAWIVGLTGLSHRAVQVAALHRQIVPERYSRNQRTLCCDEQLRLLASHVAIIGLGGLGGTVLEILARIGLGKLTLVDGDRFEDSNLNRQMLSTPGLLGQMKAEAAGRRVAELNPAVQSRIFTEFFTDENGLEILDDVDIAVDCLDTIPARFLLEEKCRQRRIPMVSAAIGGTSGQATVVFPEDSGLKRIYGTSTRTAQRGVEASLGTLPFAATAMAAIECAEVVALAAGRTVQLRDKLLIGDFSDHSLDKISFLHTED
ncbi:MAG: HesA/MoeB/ThiF family protein [Desulfopila sp.]